ncbi:MAG TPA: hypothetical protein VM182_01420, partial [Terriglobia bacterium]|nr:hypothetical protein [Terriglobia bacterium]
MRFSSVLTSVTQQVRTPGSLMRKRTRRTCCVSGRAAYCSGDIHLGRGPFCHVTTRSVHPPGGSLRVCCTRKA